MDKEIKYNFNIGKPKERKEVKERYFNLRKIKGEVVLSVEDTKGYGFYILSINEDGQISLFGGIDDDMGLDTDGEGAVEIKSMVKKQWGNDRERRE